MNLPHRVKDLSGQQFGRLVAIEYAGKNAYGITMWSCKCLCGNIISVNRSSLQSGATTSCGCYAQEKILQRHCEVRNDKIGKKFGKLLVENVNTIGVHGVKSTTFNCLCECGNRTVVTTTNLVSGHTTSCGCYVKEIGFFRNESFRENMVGRTFGMLLVKNVAVRSEGPTKYTCLCECGTETIVIGTNLSRGNTTSCGCHSRQMVYDRMTTHGLSWHPLYRIWGSMIQRCSNENQECYYYYGSKGISICDEWRYDFMSFYNWAMLNGYQENQNLTIERINSEGNYEPDNCCWATRLEQSRNREIVKLSIEDAEKIRADPRRQIDIAEEYKVSQVTISSIKLNKIWKV